MRSRKQFAVRLVVALGIAFVGMGAIGTVIAFSAVERARMIAEETITQPFRPPVPKAEYRLSDQQQLRRTSWVGSQEDLAIVAPVANPGSNTASPLSSQATACGLSRSSRTSRSRALIRSRSSVVRPGRLPSSRSAWRPQQRSVSGLQPPLRWTAAGMMEAAKGFRRLKAYKHPPVLRAALAAHLSKYVTQLGPCLPGSKANPCLEHPLPAAGWTRRAEGPMRGQSVAPKPVNALSPFG